MRAELKMNGVAELEKAIENAEKKMVELKTAVAEVSVALAKVGVEIHQPPDGSDN